LGVRTLTLIPDGYSDWDRLRRREYNSQSGSDFICIILRLNSTLFSAWYRPQHISCTPYKAAERPLSFRTYKVMHFSRIDAMEADADFNERYGADPFLEKIPYYQC
jgi:hypothetical protein